MVWGDIYTMCVLDVLPMYGMGASTLCALDVLPVYGMGDIENP